MKVTFFRNAIISLMISSLSQTAYPVILLEEYDTLQSPSVPTIFCLESPDKQIFSYIGTSHDKNPRNAQYKRADKEWLHFLELTHGGKNAVIVREALSTDCGYSGYTTKEQAITYGGDCGYATWLAETHKIPLVSTELPHKVVVQQLLKEFSTDEVYYFCFAMAADFWSRYNEKPDLEFFILDKVHRWTGNTSITFEQLAALHQKYTGKALSTPTSAFFTRLMTLTYHTSWIERWLTSFFIPSSVLKVIYPVLRRSHQIRDTYTLEQIQSAWKQGKHLFIIYGALHAITLKPHLEKLTQQ